MHLAIAIWCLLVAWTEAVVPPNKARIIENEELYNTQGQALGVLLQNTPFSASELITLGLINRNFKEWINYQDGWHHVKVLHNPTCYPEFAKSVFINPNPTNIGPRNVSSSRKPTVQVHVPLIAINREAAEVEVKCLEYLLQGKAQVEFVINATEKAQRKFSPELQLRILKQRLLNSAIDHKLPRLGDFLLSLNTTSFMSGAHLNRAITTGSFEILQKMIPEIPNGYVWYHGDPLNFGCDQLRAILRHHDPPSQVLDFLPSGTNCPSAFHDAAQYGRTNALRYLILKEFQDQSMSTQQLNSLLMESLSFALRDGPKNVLVMLMDEFRLTFSQPDMELLTAAALCSKHIETFEEFYNRFKSRVDFTRYLKHALVISSTDVIKFLLHQIRNCENCVLLEEATFCIQTTWNYERVLWILNETTKWNDKELDSLSSAIKKSFRGKRLQQLKQVIKKHRELNHSREVVDSSQL